MERIYPLHEEVIHQFCGMPICVVMNNGSRHVGILSYCRDGRVMLNDETNGADIELIKPPTETPPKTQKKKAGKKAKVAKKPIVQPQAYPYDRYYYNPLFPFGGALALELALVSSVFLL